jgi:hypothetical protein
MLLERMPADQQDPISPTKERVGQHTGAIWILPFHCAALEPINLLSISL